MSMIGEALAWLRSVQDEHLTDPVTLTRGGVATITKGMLGRSEKTSVDMRGATTAYTETTFIVAVLDYTFNAMPAVPAVGDTIDHGDNIYTVNRISGGDCFRYADASMLAYRIYVDLTGEVDE